MPTHNILLPSSDTLILDERSSWARPINASERAEFSKLLKRHLVVETHDACIKFFLKEKAVEIPIHEILEAKLLYFRRAKGPGWISLEIKNTNANQLVRLLEIGEFSEAGLAWFQTQTSKLESWMKTSIDVIDCGFDC